MNFLADVLGVARVDQGLGRLAWTVSRNARLTLKIFGNRMPFIRHTLGRQFDLQGDDTIRLRIQNNIHGQSATRRGIGQGGGMGVLPV